MRTAARAEAWRSVCALAVAAVAALLLLASTPAANLRVDPNNGHFITEFGDVPMCMNEWSPWYPLSVSAAIFALLLLALLLLSWKRMLPGTPSEEAVFDPWWRRALAFALRYGFVLRGGLLLVLLGAGCLAGLQRYGTERRLEAEMAACQRVADAARKYVDDQRRHHSPAPRLPAPSHSASNCGCVEGDPLCSCL